MATPIVPPTPAPESKPVNIFDLDSLLDYPDKPEEKPAPKKEEAKKEEETAPEKFKHAHRHILAGRESGLTDAEMEVLNPDDLFAEIDFRRQKRLADMEAEVRAAKKATAPKQEEKPEDDFAGVDLSEFDDRLVAILKDQAKQIKELKGQIAGQQEHSRRQAQATVSERMDALFTQNSAVFGAGSGEKLNPRSKEAARRGAVVGEMMRMAHAGQKSTLEADFKAACEALGFDAPPEKEALEADKQRWANAGLGKPTSRKEPEQPKGEAKAKTAVRDAMERNGMTIHGEAKYEDFPD